MPYNILNVLSAYVWVMRLTDGEPDGAWGAGALLHLAPVLSKAASFDAAPIAVKTVAHLAQSVSSSVF